MRVLIHGEGPVAASLRSLVARDSILVLGELVGAFKVSVVTNMEPTLTVDGVDSEGERLLVSHLAQVGPVLIDSQRAKGERRDAIVIGLPPHADETMQHGVETAVYRALLELARPAGFWLRLWRRLGIGARR